MVMFKRIGFFLLVNFLIILMVGVVWQILSHYFGFQDSVYGIGGLVFCALFGMGGAFISLRMSKWMAKKMMGVQIIEPRSGGQHQEIVQQVHGLARRAGLSTMPEVGVYNSPDVNAFATGPSKNNSLVAVSSGLLQQMRPDELEGVLAHEVAHIANGDMVTMTLLQGVINTLVLFLARAIAHIIASSGDRDRGFLAYFAIYMALQIVLGALGSLVVCAFSRWREYRADHGGARLAGREKMLAALEALQRILGDRHPRQEEGHEAVAALKISGSSWLAVFSTHPPLKDRIRRLQGRSV